jgi:SAM-dependent methyltransferase
VSDFPVQLPEQVVDAAFRGNASKAPRPAAPVTDDTDVAITRRKTCPICESDAATLALAEPYDSPDMQSFLAKQYEGRARIEPLRGFQYELVRCAHCGLLYQRTIPAGKFVDELYEHWIPISERERLRRSYTLDDAALWAGQVHFLVEHLRLPPHAVQVLDFGMGWGEWASMARAFGCQVAGAELSVERIRHAHSIGIETVTLADIARRKFHFINTEQVFEHLTDPVGILKSLAPSLHPGGLLKISVPNSRRVLRKLPGIRQFGELAPELIMPVQPLEHVNCFEYTSLVHLAQKAGLAPVRPKLRQLYNSSCGWMHPRQVLRLLARPIYRHVFPKSTFVYFTPAQP